ncbi:GNAT family N-acetyltransferase [Heyndrickxia sporothermodurans]
MNSEIKSQTLFKNLSIETERLIIRPYQLEDTQDLFNAISDPHFYDYIPESPPSIKEVEDIIKWSMDCNNKNTIEKIYKLNLGIIFKETDCFIGFCGLGPYDLNPAKIEIYYGLNKDFRGKGLATEAAKALLDFGFSNLKLDEIVTTVFPQNVPSVRVLEKIGMTKQYSITNPPKGHNDFKGMDYYTILR